MYRSFGMAIMVAVAAVTTAAAPSTIINVAHRGASAHAPENTLAAFELAEEQGADMFELDVQETADGELVLMHDTTLARTTDAEELFPDRAPWRVGDFTLAEIRALDAGSWFDEDYSAEGVPTLEEALEEMGGGALDLLLEIKTPELYPGIEERVADELADNPEWLDPGRLVVQSFDWDSMRTFHEILPDIPVGLLGTPARKDLPALSEFATQINPPHQDLTPAYVKAVHAQEMEVFTWTVDTPRAMRRLISMNVDGIITNRPDVLDDVLDS